VDELKQQQEVAKPAMVEPPLSVKPKKLFCAECGTQLELAAKFCPECGTKTAAGLVEKKPKVAEVVAGEDVEGEADAVKLSGKSIVQVKVDPRTDWECFGMIEPDHIECKQCPFAKECEIESKKNA
jgi:hypothetical protein